MEKKYYERKLTQALLILSVGLVFLIIGLLIRNRSAAAETETTKPVLELDPYAVTEIVCLSDEKIDFILENGVWDCAGMDFQVDQSLVDELCKTVCSIEPVRVLEDAVDYYSIFGFHKPVCTITVNSGGMSVSLLIGSYNLGTDTYYMIRGDEPDKVYLVRDKYVEPFIVHQADIVPGLEDSLPVSGRVFALDVRTGTEEIRLTKAERLGNPLYSADYAWAVEGIYSDTVPAYDSRVSAFISALLAVSECDRASYLPDDATLEKMDFANGTSVALEYDDGNGHESLAEIAFSAPNAEGTVYVAGKDFRLIYEMDQETYSTLSKYFNPYYLLPKNLCRFETSALKELKIEGNSLELDILIDNSAGTDTYSLNGDELSGEAFSQFMSALTSLNCEGYLPSESVVLPQHVADTLTISFIMNNGIETAFSLQMYDANFYIGKIGPIDSALISKTNVTQLKELAHELVK